jgi:hypothetical protein
MTDRYKTGSGQICSVKYCSNSRKRLFLWNNSECDEHVGILHKDCACIKPFCLHKCPKNEEIRREWIKALNRKELPKYIIVCSEHFIDGKPTQRNPSPKLRLGYNTPDVKEGRNPPINRHVKKRKIEINLPTEDNNYSPEDEQLHEDNQPSQTCYEDEQTHESNQSPADQLPQDINSAAADKPIMVNASTQYEDITIQDHGYTKLISLCNSCTKHVQTDSSVMSSIGIQCNLDIDDSVAKREILTDTDALFMAGVTFTAFWTIVSTLSKLDTFNFTLPLEDQILMVLMRLRQDLELGMLAKMFKVSHSYVSKVINAWIPLMATELGQLVVWLPRETISATLPHSFLDNFSKTTCIIDCAETFIQRPSNLKDRAETYSFYKGHNTAKYLVGISPNGLIMFVSRSYGGRASDKYIVNDSGFLDFLRPGDEIMGDRGFTIDEELFVRKVKLTIPAFTKGRKQLPSPDVTSTRRIANVRIHVERAIRRLKVFRILSGTVPVNSLKKFDEILIVCAALVNLRPDLVKDRDA